MKKYIVSAPEDWVLLEEPDLTTTSSQSSPYYFILVGYQELVLDDRICRYKRTIEKINDESRIEDASLYITELQDDNHQLIFHSVCIIRNGKRFSVLEEDNISVNQREMSLENHVTDKTYTVSFSINDLRVGDIIDYQTTTVTYAGDHPLSGRYYYSLFWLNWNCEVLRQVVRIVNKSGKTIDLQTSTMHDGVPQSATESIINNQLFEREFTGIKSSSFEDVAPIWLWPDFMMATTHLAWSELSSYLYHFYEKQGVFSSSVDYHDIDGLKPQDNIEANIIRAVRFVQNDIRYKGENHGVFTHTPKSPDLTLKNRYGDCKDKSSLLVALLHNLGVKAHLTLVNTEYGSKIGKLNPSPYHFNHMIVHVEHDQRVYYFDPTIKKQSGDLNNSTSLNYGYGLILSAAGRTLEKIKHDFSKNVFMLKHVFDFSRQNSTDNLLRISRTYFAHRADNIRYYINSKHEDALVEEYLKYAKDETELELAVEKKISVVRDDAQKNEIETEEIYRITSLTENDDNKELHIPTNIYHEFPFMTNRNHPLRIELDGNISHAIEVIYKGVAPSVSGGVNISNKWFTYNDSIMTKGSVVYLSASAVPHRSYVESKDLDTYLDDVDKMRQRSVNNFLYKSGDYAFLNKAGGKMMLGALVMFMVLIALRMLR